MKRFLIFPLLFPALVLVVLCVATMFREPLVALQAFLDLLGFAYVIALIPGMLLSFVDHGLARTSLNVRLFAISVAGAVVALATARHLGQSLRNHDAILVAAMGAIPAAICSWLSMSRKESDA